MKSKVEEVKNSSSLIREPPHLSESQQSIPWVLAITNKFSVSAHQQKMLVNYARRHMKHLLMTQVINSCPSVLPSVANSPQSQSPTDYNLRWKEAAQRMIQTPLSLASMPFQKKATVFPVRGIGALQQLVHRVLRCHEEIALRELANVRLSIELAKEKERSSNMRRFSRKGKFHISCSSWCIPGCWPRHCSSRGFGCGIHTKETLKFGMEF